MRFFRLWRLWLAASTWTWMPQVRFTLAPAWRTCRTHSWSFWQLGVGQFGRDHFHGIQPACNVCITIFIPFFCLNAAIVHQSPFFSVRIGDIPAVIVVGTMPWLSPKIGCQCLGRLFTGDACHLHLHAEALVLDANFAQAAASSFRSSSSTALIRLPMASMTLTVTPLPACLYAWASEVMARILSICPSSNPGGGNTPWASGAGYGPRAPQCPGCCWSPVCGRCRAPHAPAGYCSRRSQVHPCPRGRPLSSPFWWPP